MDAGFRKIDKSCHPGKAGLGVWIPALGTGVALPARSNTNNDAESMAILLGVVVGSIMHLTRTTVVTDSRLNYERVAECDEGKNLDGILSSVHRSLCICDVLIEWMPREATSQADFFASLALEGKSLVASISNAKNSSDKLRPLLHAERNNRISIKDVNLKWLSLPHASPPSFAGLPPATYEIYDEIRPLLLENIPEVDFFVLWDYFANRVRKGKSTI